MASGQINHIEYALYAAKILLKSMRPYKNLTCIGPNKRKCQNNGWIISDKRKVKITNINTS
jgi:hypothetical protein